MLWILPAFFAFFGLPLAIFPRFFADRTTHVSPYQPEDIKKGKADALRGMGIVLLLTAVVFAGLILTGVLR